jgi:hypothetical protein
MSQRSGIDAAVLLESFFRRNLRNITIRQTRDELAAQEAPVSRGFSRSARPWIPAAPAVAAKKWRTGGAADSAASATGLLSNPVRLLLAKLGAFEETEFG